MIVLGETQLSGGESGWSGTSVCKIAQVSLGKFIKISHSKLDKLAWYCPAQYEHRLGKNAWLVRSLGDVLQCYCECCGYG